MNREMKLKVTASRRDLERAVASGRFLEIFVWSCGQRGVSPTYGLYSDVLNQLCNMRVVSVPRMLLMLAEADSRISR